MPQNGEDILEPAVVLKRNRAKPVLQHHPWVYSGAIERVEGEPADGDVVDVCDAGNNWLARGYINQQSQIVVRLLTWRRDESIDSAFWRRRLERAVAARQPLADDLSTNAYRLVHAESDYLPGLIVDRYGDWLVVQFLTLGVERWRDELTGLLADLLGAVRGICERSDSDVREKEGLGQRIGMVWGEEPPGIVEILENGHRFLVDLCEGHKTGFYLDQRENRARLPAFCAGAEVLDAFCYTGGFSVYAAAGGAAKIALIDSSAPSLELARRNLALDESSGPDVEYIEGSVFNVLRGYRAQNRCFDVIVLDPPKFAPSGRELEKASRAYKDVNMLAFQLLRAGGMLFTFSCSGAVTADLFRKIVFGAALDAGRDAQIVGHLAQGRDHPVALTFPEGAYLKGLICRVG
jgi:23S rRNA (cytosine1962-C5)-methyltransferase